MNFRARINDPSLIIYEPIAFDFNNKNKLGKIQLNLVIMIAVITKKFISTFRVSICNFTVYNGNTSMVP
jgi:hypothetical protein